MQGSLYLPLRGTPVQLAQHHRNLFIRARHPDGDPLGLYRFPLHDWSQGNIADEVRASTGGLYTLETGATLTWISASSAGLWWVNERDEIGGFDEENNRLITLGQVTNGGHERARWCAHGDRLIGLVPTDDGWRLEEVKRRGDQVSSSTCWEGEFGRGVEPKVSAFGPEVAGWGLSDGRVALWFEGTRVAAQSEWSPHFTQPHQDPVTALGFTYAEGRAYLLSYSEDLTLAQTRLDDLEPMPRAAKGKGLHTTPPIALVSGGLGRFYTVGADGVRAWNNTYSNLRPASHEEVGEAFGGLIRDALSVTGLVKNLEGRWEEVETLAILGSSKIELYTLLNPSEEKAIETGEDESAQRGRLGAVHWRAEGVDAWLNHRLKEGDEAVRAATVETILHWDDELALNSLESVAKRDEIAKLRSTALDALIKSQHPKAIHALARLLTSEHKAISGGAFEALRSAYGETSLYPMRQALSAGQVSVGERALKALGDLGSLDDQGRGGDDAARSYLREQLDHSDVELSEYARAELERCYLQPRSVLLGLQSKHIPVKTMALHRLWEESLTHDPVVAGRLQQLREDSSEEVRRYALAVTLLGTPQIAKQLRADDPLLHDELNKVEARRLIGDDRANALAATLPERSTDEVDSQGRQLLFELSTCGQADVAVHGPVALAQTGDLRALPALLALSRSGALSVRVRATRGLVSLAAAGESRASAQLQSLVMDQETEVRLLAFRGLAPLFEDVVAYAQLGLTAPHADVRLAGLTALSAAQGYQAAINAEDSASLRLQEALSSALLRRDDLGLAQEARKLYLKDQVGGSREAALALIAGSVHDEVRRLVLSDLLVDLKGGGTGVSADGSGAGGGDGLGGQSFLFTGTLTTMKRADAQKKVKALGGVAASSVSSDLSYLVIGDAGKAGSKLTKANSLGVPVISETEFMQMLENVEKREGADERSEASSEVDPAVQAQAQLRVMRRLFSDRLSSLRLEAVKRLIGAEEGDGVLVGDRRVSAIETALGARHQDVRLASIEAIRGAADPSQSQERLRILVTDPDVKVAQAALSAALKLAGDDLEGLIEAGIAYEDDHLRSIAVEAAARAPKKMTWREGILLRAIADGVRSIRDLAFEALRGDEVVSVAAQLLDHSQRDIRDRAALTLARVGDERALVVALEALQAPVPTADEVIAAQEAQGGPLGLMDDFQWKRQVTIALSAQQRAFASASASALSQASTGTGERGSEAIAGASATGVAYAEQSLSALVSINDQIEGAVERAQRLWRQRVSAAIKIVRVGRFEEGFDAIWALKETADETLRGEIFEAAQDCAPISATPHLMALLSDHMHVRSSSSALVALGDERGFTALLGSGASPSRRVQAAIALGGAAAQRSLAQEMVRGGSAARAALSGELVQLLAFGGDCPLITAGLASEDIVLRRLCAQWMERVHSPELIRTHWLEEMEERRPSSDREWEKENARFEAGEREVKPKGSKPTWMAEADWHALAELLTHPEPRGRRYAAEALEELPSSSDEAKEWLTELKRQSALADRCWARRGGDREALSTARAGSETSVTQEAAQALAFGTYASLVTGERDVESLKSLGELFGSDPAGARAILQMSLRVDGALQHAAFELLEKKATELALSDEGRADLLISTDQPTCVERGARLLAQVAPRRAETLILSDEGEGASSAARALLELYPERGFELLAHSLKSPNTELRERSVEQWARLLAVWPSNEKPLETDDEEIAKARHLTPQDAKLLGVLGGQKKRREALDELLSFLGDEKGGSYAVDVQLKIAESLRSHRVFRGDEGDVVIGPLKRLLQSTEPALYKRALAALRDSHAQGAAAVILHRFLNDPTGSANGSLTAGALRTLRDRAVVSTLLDTLTAINQETTSLSWSAEDVAELILQISGHDDQISPYSCWEEMSQDEREAEEKAARQDQTLAELILRLIQLGEYDLILYSLDLIDAAKTARSQDVDEALLRLTTLPQGKYETDQARNDALLAIIWRVQNRDMDPRELAPLVNHRDPETKLGAAEALAYARRSEGVKLLMGIARDRHERYDWRQRALPALGASGDLRATQTLLALYDDPEDYFGREALEALGGMRGSEVEDEILTRLINALDQSSLVSVALQGIKRFERPEGWSAVRTRLKSARVLSSCKLMATALRDDPSDEAVDVLRVVLRESDLFDKDTRLEAYRSWCSRLRAEAGVAADDLTVILDPARIIFSTDLTHSSDWAQAVEGIVTHGSSKDWIELAFGSQVLSAKHREVINRFEAQLRELDPPPFDLLLPRLADAIKRAPQLARMTIELVGSRASTLSENERAQLVSATQDLQARWIELDAARRAGANDEEMRVTTELWTKLLWLWGRTAGGEEALWSALTADGLDAALYSEALFSLEARSLDEAQPLTLDDRILSSPAARLSEFSGVVTRLASRAGLLADALNEDRAGAMGGLRFSDWDAVSRGVSKSGDAQPLVAAAQRGDAMALSALVSRADHLDLISLLGSLAKGELSHLDEVHQLDLVSASATAGSEAVEEALVALAKSETSEAVQQEAWRARRRSQRRRLQRSKMSTFGQFPSV